MIKEYLRKGYWTYEAVCDLWDKCAERYPDKEALADSKIRLTWGEAKRLIDRLALGLLELKIQSDALIVFQLPPSVELFLLRVACEKAGILGLIAARHLRNREMEFIFNKVGNAAGYVIPWKFGGFDYFKMYEEMKPNIPPLRHLIVSGDTIPEGAISLRAMLEQPLEQKYPHSYLKGRKFAATDTSLIVHTTGTTGMPKLVELAACSRLCQGREWIKTLALTGDDILGMFIPAPAGPNTPFYYGAPYIGAKVVILERFDAEEALKLIQRERITFGTFVPTMLVMMTNHPNFSRYDLSSLRFVQVGGAPLPYHTAEELERKLKCPVYQTYGGVDHDPSAMHSIGDPPEVRHLTVGKPNAGSEFRILDDNRRELPRGEIGEVWGRGPACPPGFYRDEKGTWEAWRTGWINTEDLGKLDEDGNLVLVGRKRDIIIRGGQNIYPSEIEDILCSHPSIADAAVVKMPDAVMGEKCCAYVVLAPGRHLSFDEIVSFLKENKFAPYKLPERVEFVEKLPKLGEQKVAKTVLEQDIIEKLEAEGKI